MKTQVVVTRRRKATGRGAKPRRARVAAVSPTPPGTTQETKVLDRARVVCPPGVKRTGDTVDLGTGLETPRRKPAGGERTARQEAGNRRVSRRRVAVERYRNPRRRHTLIMKYGAGLHNRMFA